MDNPQTVIVGMGQAGLEQALELFHKMHRVTLIDQAADPFQRELITPLDPIYVQRLFYTISDLELAGVALIEDPIDVSMPYKFAGLDNARDTSPIDWTFFTIIVKQQGKVALKDLQAYLLAKLLQKAQNLKTTLAEVKNSTTDKKLNAILQINNPILLWKILNYFNSALIDAGVYIVLNQQHHKLTEILDSLPHLQHPLSWRYNQSEVLAKLHYAIILAQQLPAELKEKFHAVVETCFNNFLDFAQNPVTVLTHSTLANIDLLEGSATLSEDGSTATIKPENIILAEGAARQTLAETENLHFLIMDLPVARPEQQAFGSVKIKYAATDCLRAEDPIIISPSLPNTSRLSTHDLGTLRKVGWQASYLPALYIQYIATAGIFYVAGEIPNELLECTDRAQQIIQLREFVIAVLCLQYPQLHPEAFESSVNGQNYTVKLFKPNFIDYDPSKLIGKSRIFVIGEAFLMSNIFDNHGIMDAYQDACSVADCFDNDAQFIDYGHYALNMQLRLADYNSTNQNLKNLLYLYEHPTTLRFIRVVEQATTVLSSSSNTIRWLYKTLSGNGSNDVVQSQGQRHRIT